VFVCLCVCVCVYVCVFWLATPATAHAPFVCIICASMCVCVRVCVCACVYCVCIKPWLALPASETENIVLLAESHFAKSPDCGAVKNESPSSVPDPG